MSKKIKMNIVYFGMMLVSAVSVRVVAANQVDYVAVASVQKYDTINYQKVSYEKPNK